MSKLIAPSIAGYKPERLGDAIELAWSLDDVTAIVMSGMADSVLDETVSIHNAQNEGIVRHEYGSEISDQLVNIGWNLGYLASQSSDITHLPFVKETQTTIDFVRAGEGVDWHTDIVPMGEFKYVSPGQRRAIAVPFGWGVSMNLVDFAIFRVAVKCDLPTVTSDVDLLPEAINNVLERRKASKPDDYYEAFLRPGDVIIWRQPAAHNVKTFEARTSAEKRIAIVLVNQDIVVTP